MDFDAERIVIDINTENIQSKEELTEIITQTLERITSQIQYYLVTDKNNKTIGKLHTF